MDLALDGFTDEDLVGILISMGIDDTMSREEMIQTITKMEDTNSVETSTSHIETFDHGNKQEDKKEVGREEKNFEQLINPQANADEAESTTPKNDLNSEVELSDNQAELVVNFLDVTGGEEQQAKGYLEAAFWDLDRAVSLFLENERSNSGINNFINTTPDRNPPNLNNTQRDDSDDEFHQYHGNEMERMMQDLMRRHLSGQQTVDEPPSPIRKQESYDEEGYRKPDAVRTQRLLSGRELQYNEDEEGFAHVAVESNIDWFFPLPSYNTLEPFSRVRNRASHELKWVLVNMQNHTIWDSQAMNRDLWADDALRDFLSESFIFWQRNFSSIAGREYMGTYNVNEDSLPQIHVIDPHTGARLFSWTGPISPEDLISKLLEFTEKHKLKPLKAEPAEGATTTSKMTTTNTVVAPPAPPMESLKSPSMKEKYGAPPSEPNENDSDIIKVSIKLVSGKTINRKYRKNDLVHVLFAVTAAVDPDSDLRAFELCTRFPAQQLSSVIDQTLENSKLANSSVLQRWI